MQTKYEYDLGKVTSCYQCGRYLKEGQTVWTDNDNQVFCSEECYEQGGYHADQS